MEFGVNYQARGDFDPSQLTDAEMKEDLDLFENQGVNHIIVIMFWTSMEPNFSDPNPTYNTTYLNRLIRFIDYANSRGFQVSLDTHVHMIGSQGAPSWFSQYGNGQVNMTNVFTEPMRSHWIKLHGWLAQQIGHKLHSVTAWNEPYLQGSALTISEFVALFQELRVAWKSISSSLFTIRTAIYGLHQFWDSPGFYSACDFISINIYPNRYGGHTYERLLTAVTKAWQNGKDWQITETGFDSDNDQTQYNGLNTVINGILQRVADAGLPPPMMMNIWIWLRATISGMVWSLCDVNGNPRPAFTLLSQPNGSECTVNSDCTDPAKPYCDNGVCVQCTVNNHCPTGQICVKGACVSRPPPKVPLWVVGAFIVLSVVVIRGV